MTEKLASADRAIFPTPDEAFRALDVDAEEAGGEWVLPAEEEGAIGRTMFDLPTSHDGTFTVLLPASGIENLPSQALVRIVSRGDGRVYLGAVAEGPFAEADGLRADSTPMVVSTVRGGLLTPKYHGRVQVEVLGEQLRGGATVPPRHRPTPNSPVFALGAAETAEVLKITGDLRLGLADGFEDLVVAVPQEQASLSAPSGCTGNYRRRQVHDGIWASRKGPEARDGRNPTRYGGGVLRYPRAHERPWNGTGAAGSGNEA